MRTHCAICSDRLNEADRHQGHCERHLTETCDPRFEDLPSWEATAPARERAGFYKFGPYAFDPGPPKL